MYLIGGAFIGYVAAPTDFFWELIGSYVCAVACKIGGVTISNGIGWVASKWRC
ncbi:hypothetical protein IQ247_23855 [Plectonema cf. radiosum LEGE 06105]|uniref:Uncharacterized protein n=1 Tax=Plectonema cf. radiosum LEGE 06105 TaxID=945769 RepID=A0A8J7K3W7_9CYAN|nr:hypothetical protein [Plectonema radiosum]MBE9215662.1 hypothetical protein [Plectonema cf. radiosum LEGE 06105]